MILVAPSVPVSREPMSANAAAPVATRVVVLSPAERWRHCRSKPISVPKRKATPRATTVRPRAYKSGTMRRSFSAVRSDRRMLNRDLPANFDDRIGGQSEIIAHVHRVALHEGIDRLNPMRQSLGIVPRHHGLMADKIRHIRQIDIAAVSMGVVQKRRN